MPAVMKEFSNQLSSMNFNDIPMLIYKDARGNTPIDYAIKDNV